MRQSVTMHLFLKFIFFLLFLSSTVYAKEDKWSQPQTYLYFADSLADTGDYYRAITEYKRVLFHFPEYEKKDWVNFQIGRMYHIGGRFESAKSYLTPLTASPFDDLRFLSRNWLALTYFENSEYVNSARLFSELAETATGKVRKSDYLTYEAVSRFHLNEFTTAGNLFADLDSEENGSEMREFAKKASELNELAADRSPKSRYISVPLSVLFPGAGHLYLGQWDTSLVTLLVIAGTGFLAYDGFERDNLVQASIFLTFATGFYAGSIYSAYRETGRMNATLYDEDRRSMNREFRRLTLKVSKAF